MTLPFYQRDKLTDSLSSGSCMNAEAQKKSSGSERADFIMRTLTGQPQHAAETAALCALMYQRTSQLSHTVQSGSSGKTGYV